MDKKSILRWRKRNSYYYGWLDKIYRFVIRPNSRVLHVGCQSGDLLAAVKPSYGVGIDPDKDNIALAQERFGDMKFIVADPHELELDETFDYVIISNTLGSWHDIQQVFEKIKPLTHEKTRIVVSYYNHTWEWILRLGTILKIRRPEPYQNWLPSDDICNLLDLSGFDIIRKDSYVMCPKNIPLIA
jgi:2-polyprenyl-3-methyl-5-hydroxy-6-metoxy-1,4-benzoquinol methylase